MEGCIYQTERFPNLRAVSFATRREYILARPGDHWPYHIVNIKAPIVFKRNKSNIIIPLSVILEINASIRKYVLVKHIHFPEISIETLNISIELFAQINISFRKHKHFFA